jgi:hypothetical protein
MDVTCTTTKLAWKRNPDVPAGQPALGRFDCVCGNVIRDVEFAGPDDNPCSQCGRVWDGRGWLVSEVALPAGLKATRQGEGLLGW